MQSAATTSTGPLLVIVGVRDDERRSLSVHHDHLLVVGNCLASSPGDAYLVRFHGRHAPILSNPYESVQIRTAKCPGLPPRSGIDRLTVAGTADAAAAQQVRPPSDRPVGRTRPASSGRRHCPVVPAARTLPAQPRGLPPTPSVLAFGHDRSATSRQGHILAARGAQRVDRAEPPKPRRLWNQLLWRRW
jgi:hypothetical protein